jgi:hypothetical protein
MNKTIIQLGILAFCVSGVFFGTQEMRLIDTVARSFIVFVAVIAMSAGVIIASSIFGTKRETPAQGRPVQPNAAEPTPKNVHAA